MFKMKILVLVFEVKVKVEGGYHAPKRFGGGSNCRLHDFAENNNKSEPID
jgi:hypothetical protein